MSKPREAVQLSCVLTEVANRWMAAMGRMTCVRRDDLGRVLIMAPFSRLRTWLWASFSQQGLGYLEAINFTSCPTWRRRETYASLPGAYCSETGRSFPFRMQRAQHTALLCRSTVRFEPSIHFGWNLCTFPAGKFDVGHNAQQEGAFGSQRVDATGALSSQEFDSQDWATTFCTFTWFHVGFSTSNFDAMQPWEAQR